MKKIELVAEMAAQAEMTKTDAGKALDAFIAVVSEALNKEDSVTIVGFGTFEVRKRKARIKARLRGSRADSPRRSAGGGAK